MLLLRLAALEPPGCVVLSSVAEKQLVVGILAAWGVPIVLRAPHVAVKVDPPSNGPQARRRGDVDALRLMIESS